MESAWEQFRLADDLEPARITVVGIPTARPAAVSGGLPRKPSRMQPAPRPGAGIHDHRRLAGPGNAPIHTGDVRCAAGPLRGGRFLRRPRGEGAVCAGTGPPGVA